MVKWLHRIEWLLFAFAATTVKFLDIFIKFLTDELENADLTIGRITLTIFQTGINLGFGGHHRLTLQYCRQSICAAKSPLYCSHEISAFIQDGAGSFSRGFDSGADLCSLQKNLHSHPPWRSDAVVKPPRIDCGVL